ncbi:MAG TPA: hypothetical protein VFP54_09670 [Acidimicrobiales bacterium]|nr:hypothetical protein [Acidimicrobiales bacterium]
MVQPPLSDPAAGRSLDGVSTAPDLGLAGAELVGGGNEERPTAGVEFGLAGVQGALPQVGGPFSTVGHQVSLIGRRLPLVGRVVPSIGG